MKIFRILILLLLAYLAFVVFTFPASFATTRLNAAKPEVQINDVDGSIWSGGAGDIRYQGIPIGALEWSAQPLGILQGEWKNHLVLNGIVDGEGELSYGIDGVVNLYNTTLDTNVSEIVDHLHQRIPAQMKQFKGEVQADIIKMAVAAGKLPSQQAANVTGALPGGFCCRGDYYRQAEIQDRGAIDQ